MLTGQKAYLDKITFKLTNSSMCYLICKQTCQTNSPTNILHFYELTCIADSICQCIFMLTSLRFDNSITLHVNSLQIDEFNQIFF